MTATLMPAESGQLEMDLSEAEQTELRHCEEIIRVGKEAFTLVGNAMADIRDKRLYRATHTTFEAYCRDKHGFSKTHANRWITAAAMMAEMQAVGVDVENENQARNLARLSEDARQEAIEEAQSRAEEPDKPLSARDVLKVAEELRPEPIITQPGEIPTTWLEDAPVLPPDWFPRDLSAHSEADLHKLQDGIANSKFKLGQQIGLSGVSAQTVQPQIDSLEAALTRIDAEWTRRATGDPDAKEADVEALQDKEPQAQEQADTDAAQVSPAALPAPVTAVSPAPITASAQAQEIVTTLDKATQTPAAPAALSVVDKRAERSADLDRAAPVPAPAASASVAPAPAPSGGGMVMAMIPRSEQDYLNAEGLTAATAIALLRGLRAEPAPPVSKPLTTGYHAPLTAFVLGPEALEALWNITRHANKSGTSRTPFEQLESILITRARLIHDDEFDTKGTRNE